MWKMQLRMFQDNKQVWKDIHPSYSRIPYLYETQAEALTMLNICYPNQTYGTDVRVVEEEKED